MGGSSQVGGGSYDKALLSGCGRQLLVLSGLEPCEAWRVYCGLQLDRAIAKHVLGASFSPFWFARCFSSKLAT